MDAILVDTGTTLPNQITGLNNLSPAEVNAEVDQALADYDGPTNAEMEARTLPSADYFDADNDDVNLASTALDNIPITEPNGVASDFREMIVQLWRRFFKKATKTSYDLQTYSDDEESILTTQTISDDGVVEIQEAAE